MPISFSAKPELARVREVVGRDLPDPLVADLIQPHRRVEREPREDRHLRRGVAPVDVVGRVGLGVAEPLRLGQRLLEGQPAPRHLAEDEVGGAVDDPVDAVDARARKRLLEHAHDGHHARDRRLEAQLHAGLAGAREQLVAVLGEQLLVGGDDVPPGAHRLEHVAAGRLDPADQLDDQVRASRISSKSPLERVSTPATSGRRPVIRSIRLGVLGDQLGEGGADRAAPEQADAEDGVASARTSRLIRSS